MEENKDDYLKKKLHIKDRFIKRLETEKRQLEIDNNSLQHQLRLVECQLNGLVRNQRKNAWGGLLTNNSEQVPTQGSQRTDFQAAPRTMAGNILPRYILFPNFNASSVEAAPDLQHERIPMPAVNVGQDDESDQLLNKNLEYTLEISYLKARLKSSDTARAVAERTIENLEEKLRQLENISGRQTSGVVSSTPEQNNLRHNSRCSSDSYRPPSHANPMNAPIKSCNSVYPPHPVFPSKPTITECPVVYCTIMNCLDRILQVVLSLDEKINHIQKECHNKQLQGTSS